MTGSSSWATILQLAPVSGALPKQQVDPSRLMSAHPSSKEKMGKRPERERKRDWRRKTKANRLDFKGERPKRFHVSFYLSLDVPFLATFSNIFFPLCHCLFVFCLLLTKGDNSTDAPSHRMGHSPVTIMQLTSCKPKLYHT